MRRILFAILGFCLSTGAFSAEPTNKPPKEITGAFSNGNMTVPETEPLLKLARENASAYGYRATNLKVEPHIAELIRLRVSQINHCSYCLYVHYYAAEKIGIPKIRIDTLNAWWATDLYSDAEKAAIEFAEALTQLDNKANAKQFPNLYQQLAKFYTEQQIIELAGIVINMNIWTRIKLAEGAQARPIDQGKQAD